MHSPSQLLTVGLLLYLSLFLTSCTKTVTFDGTTKKIKPLNSNANIIVLHEDYIFAEPQATEVKKYLIEKIQEKMRHFPKYKLMVISSGREIPQNNGNDEMIILMGDIWLHKGTTAGDQVMKVSRSSRSLTSFRTWEEIEQRHWKQNTLQTIISLYFIEVGSSTKILRSTVTASNDKKQVTRVGGRSLSNNQTSQFFQDKEVKAGHQVLKAKNSIDQPRLVFKELAARAADAQLDSL